MTLTYVICILGVPIAGIAAIGAALARQFILRNREFVRLAGLDDEFAPIALPNDARNRTPEMTVTETVEDCGPPDRPVFVWVGSLCIVQQSLHVLDG